MNSKSLLFGAIALIGVFGFYKFYYEPAQSKDTIKVGVLHSLTGTMALSEIPVVDATMMAIDEINEKGGILNKKIEAISRDGKSDDQTFANEVKDLVEKDKVVAIFGCWTSACRKTIVPVVEKLNTLFLYPVQYEGLEQSPNLIYTGAAPNQQIIPAINWSFQHFGKKFFLVGSDYIFPHTANAIIKAQLAAMGGEIVAEEYIPLGSSDVNKVVKMIVELKPDVIINTINGDTNIPFFKELKEQNITADKIPVMSFSINENEVKSMGVDLLLGHYAAWNYFQSIDTKANKKFVSDFKKRYGQDRTTSDPMESAYFSVYLWAQAVSAANSTDPVKVMEALKKQSFAAPEGVVSIDPDSNHTWKTLLIGKINKEGQFDIVWSSENPIKPTPYPFYRTKADWDKFLNDLYTKWGNKWTNTPDSETSKEKSGTP